MELVPLNLRKKIQHRVSKITPTKNGQFVTLWKRNQNGITEPFDINDEIDFIIITVKKWRKPWAIYFSKKCFSRQRNYNTKWKIRKTRHPGLSPLGQSRKQTSRENPKLATQLFLNH